MGVLGTTAEVYLAVFGTPIEVKRDSGACAANSPFPTARAPTYPDLNTPLTQLLILLTLKLCILF